MGSGFNLAKFMEASKNLEGRRATADDSESVTAVSSESVSDESGDGGMSSEDPASDEDAAASADESVPSPVLSDDVPAIEESMSEDAAQDAQDDAGGLVFSVHEESGDEKSAADSSHSSGGDVDASYYGDSGNSEIVHRMERVFTDDDIMGATHVPAPASPGDIRRAIPARAKQQEENIPVYDEDRQYDEESHGYPDDAEVHVSEKEEHIPVRSPRRSSDDVETASLKKVPKSLVRRAQMLFPDCSQSDAVAAYIYHFEGCPVDIEVPDNIIEAERKFKGDSYTARNLQHDMGKSMSQIDARLKQVLNKLDAVEIAMTYMCGDRIGWRQKPQKSPASLDFLEDFVTVALKRLHAQTAEYQMREAKRAGRPKE